MIKVAGPTAIDVNLAEYGEVSVVLALGKFQYLRIATRLLGTKLVTGKGQNREWQVFELFLQSTQPGVLIGEASAAGDVDDQAGLSGKLLELDMLA